MKLQDIQRRLGVDTVAAMRIQSAHSPFGSTDMTTEVARRGFSVEVEGPEDRPRPDEVIDFAKSTCAWASIRIGHWSNAVIVFGRTQAEADARAAVVADALRTAAPPESPR